MRMQTLKMNDRTLVERCFLVTNFFRRFLGLMGRASIGANEALLFPKCNSIHTLFMRFPIDVVFIQSSGEVLEVIEALPPWRALLPRGKAKHTLEMAAGGCRAAGLSAGSRLHYEGVF